ncbi:MAG: right-handed parallel beta-helix repeat-containing protein [Verrucomicrobia bacterium]|nr:right-handed parallel beta-helix repeat-containing protein [Verrucomicrobiota bacterium]
MNKKMKIISNIVLLPVILGLLSGTAANAAKLIYVDSTIAADSIAYSVETRSATGGNAVAKKTIASATAAVAIGDTILIRAGTYAEVIYPKISGEPGNPITYKNFGNEVVYITGKSIGTTVPVGEDTSYAWEVYGIYFYDKDYITIEGLHIDNVYWARIVNTHHVILRNNTFTRAPGFGTRGAVKFITYRAPHDSAAPHESHHNQIIDNILDDGNDNLLLIHSDSNLVEGNTMTKARHTLWCIRAGSFNIVRNNYLYNDLQKVGEIYDAETDLPIQFDATKYNVVEGNIFAKTGNYGLGAVWAGIQFAGQKCIIRNNRFYNTIGPGLSFAIYGGEASYNYGNRVYHNVFDQTDFAGIALPNNWQGYAFYDNIIKNNILTNSVFVANDTRWTFYTGTLAGKPIQFMPSQITDFVFEKNSLFYSGGGSEYLITHGDRYIYGTQPHAVAWWNANHSAVFKNNMEADPLFVDAASHDYHLQRNSPMIDAGTFLTKTSGSGSGTSMAVEDASYFHDGFGIEGETGDLIQLEGGMKTARVMHIDYANNTLTLDQPLAWTSGKGVSLAYSGKAPDIGAYESDSPARPSPPVPHPVEVIK